jgi:hypothetical protein
MSIRANFILKRREVTVSQIIEEAFEGKLNFAKTKAELVKYVEENKDKKGLSLQM